MSDKENTKTAQCHACEGVVSKVAKTCPHCGQKKPYKVPTNWKKIWIYAGLGFGIWCMVSVMAVLQSNPDYQGSPAPSGGTNLEAAIRKCEAGIRGTVNNPSTVDIHRFTGFGNDIAADGTRRITQTFSAKNGFGLEQTFDAYCSLNPDGKFDIRIGEQGR